MTRLLGCSPFCHHILNQLSCEQFVTTTMVMCLFCNNVSGSYSEKTFIGGIDCNVSNCLVSSKVYCLHQGFSTMCSLHILGFTFTENAHLIIHTRFFFSSELSQGLPWFCFFPSVLTSSGIFTMFCSRVSSFL